MSREDIINNYSNNDFRELLTNDNTGLILEILNDEGLIILKNNELKEHKINYILSFSPYKDELFKKDDFLNIFFNTYIGDYYATLGNLRLDTYDVILNRALANNIDFKTIYQMFSYFSIEYRLKKIKEGTLPIELVHEIVKNNNDSKTINAIIERYDINLANYDINLIDFFSKAKESVLIAQKGKSLYQENKEAVFIPQRMITKELADKIWNEYNIFMVRRIINDAQYCTDPSKINEYIKQKEEQAIISYVDEKLQFPYLEIYESYKKYKMYELSLETSNEFREEYYKARKLFNGIINDNYIVKFDEIEEIYNQGGFEAVEAYFKKLNENNLSNYIIDYHFEENYHNVMIDIKELLNFYYNGQIAIPQERVEIYDRISNIDYLTTMEKIELHALLKNYNMITTLYEDMALARKIVAEAIKDYSLTKDTLAQYKDNELSEKHGVDVYVMNGNPFFGVVKSGAHMIDSLPTGHSFSIVGKGGLAVFGSVENSDTFLYDAADINPNQIVHVFPYDSFTTYKPFETSENATRRVNVLAMPDELVTVCPYAYTEILILEGGTKESDLNRDLPKLNKIALYCMDQIRQQDIEAAKRSGVGIILIDSKKYEEIDYRVSSSYHRDLKDNEYNYFDGMYETEKFESRR